MKCEQEGCQRGRTWQEVCPHGALPPDCCTFSLVAVFAKVTITVFVSSCLYTDAYLHLCFQQSPPNRNTRNSSAETVFKGQGGVYELFGKGRKLQYKVYDQPLLPGLSNLGIQLQVLISRVEKVFNCNCSLSALQASFWFFCFVLFYFFHSPVTQSTQSYPCDIEYIQSFIFPLFLSRLNGNNTISISSTDLYKSPMPLSQSPNPVVCHICLESTARLHGREDRQKGWERVVCTLDFSLQVTRSDRFY